LSSARSERDRRYNQSPEGKARRARYQTSAKGRAVHKRYDRTPKGLARYLKYGKTEKGQARHLRARSKPEAKEQALWSLRSRRRHHRIQENRI
jgi:hypothetical protein